MDKNSFLEALRNIFKKAHVADVESIIEVYEEHFAVGHEKGLTDDEIIKSLGTPEEIYASYVDAGIITDTLNEDGNTSKSVNGSGNVSWSLAEIGIHLSTTEPAASDGKNGDIWITYE